MPISGVFMRFSCAFLVLFFTLLACLACGDDLYLRRSQVTAVATISLQVSYLVDSVNAQLEISVRHKRLNSKTLKSEQVATSTDVVLRLSVIGVTLTSA